MTCLHPFLRLLKVSSLGLLYLTVFSTSSSAKRLHVPEPVLEKALADTLGVEIQELTEELVAQKLRYLDASNRQLRDLTGLEVAHNLEVLVLKQNLIEDITPLAGLPNLTKLDLSGNRISNLSALQGLSLEKMKSELSRLQLALQSRTLTKAEKAALVLELGVVVNRINRGTWSLQAISLSNNRLLGLSGVGHLSSLRYLDVSANSLIDLEGVGKLRNLITLNAQSNQLGRIEAYVDVDKDKEFTEGIDQVKDESGNGKRDTDPLVEIQSLPNLTNLYLYDNLLTNTLSLANLPALKFLLLAGNQLDDISNLGDFKSLIRLSLTDNRITNLNGLEGLPKIEHLYLEENLICDIRTLSTLPNLLEIRLQRNQVMSVGPLSSLKNLRVASLTGNFIHDIAPVLDLKSLKRLSLSSNCIRFDDAEIEKKISKIRSRGCSVFEGKQRPRIVEAEELIEALVSRPSSNTFLGGFIRKNNQYDRLIDIAEDNEVPVASKKVNFKNWQQNLRRGSFENLAFDFQGN